VATYLFIYISTNFNGVIKNGEKERKKKKKGKQDWVNMISKNYSAEYQDRHKVRFFFCGVFM
jgi:hypothetical protein